MGVPIKRLFLGKAHLVVPVILSSVVLSAFTLGCSDEPLRSKLLEEGVFTAQGRMRGIAQKDFDGIPGLRLAAGSK